MSILDRVTKAVGDVVDRGKKEVDQFVRIQRINGQISEIEKRIGACRAQIQQAKLGMGEIALGMIRAGTLNSSEMSPMVDQINANEQQIASEETQIAGKREEIEKIKAEDKAEKSPEEPEAVAPPPPPADPAAAARYCPQCGSRATANAGFCTQCGGKLA